VAGALACSDAGRSAGGDQYLIAISSADLPRASNGQTRSVDTPGVAGESIRRECHAGIERCAEAARGNVAG